MQEDPPSLGETATTRDERQATVFAWTKEAFTLEQAVSLPQRGLRLLEEALEAFQAAGGNLTMARRLADYVFSRPVGQLHQELGGVGVGLLALAAAADLSADEAERLEVARVLDKPLEHFQKRNAAKNAAGLLMTHHSADDFFVLSLRWTREDVVTWWAPNNSGYTSVLEQAGRYSRERIEQNPAYYNNDDLTIALPCATVEASAFRVVFRDQLEKLTGKRFRPLTDQDREDVTSCDACGVTPAPTVLGLRVIEP